MRFWQRLFGSVRKNPLLTAILVVAFALRIATINWGIPLSPYSNFYHGDEAKAYSSTIQFPEQYLGSESYLYGTAVQYTVGLLLLPVKFVMVGLLNMPAEYALTAIVFFRFCDVVMGTASVYLVFALARRLLDERAGLIAALLLAVALYPALQSCLTTLDVPMSFLLLVCLLGGLRCSDMPSTRTFCYTGIATGLLLGTKVTACLFVGCLFVWLAAALLSKQMEPDISLSDRLALLIVFAGTAAAVFAITTPQVALNFGEFWDFMMQQKSNWYDKAPMTLSGIVAAWFDGTSLAVGIPVTVTFLIGLVVLAKARPRETLLPGLCVAANYLFWRGYLPARFVIVIAPLLCVCSAALWQRLLASERVWLRRGSAALLVVAVATSSVICVLGIAQRWLDARTVAARYIAAHVPKGSTIGIATDHNNHWLHHNWRYPRINFAMLEERPFLEDPDYIVVTSLELEQMRKALDSGKLLPGDRWDPRFKREWYHDDPPAPAIFAFYRKLLAGETYTQVAVFKSRWHIRIDIAPDIYLFRRTRS